LLLNRCIAGTVPGLPVKCNLLMMEKSQTPIVVFLRAGASLFLFMLHLWRTQIRS
jgi:hypothetical protein